MNIKEKEHEIKDNYQNVINSSSYTAKDSEKPYTAKNLKSLRAAIVNLEEVDIIQDEIVSLKNSELFSNNKDEENFTSKVNINIEYNVIRIRIGLEFLLKYVNQHHLDNEGLYIRLPEIQNFEDLSKVSSDFKKAIELPILDQGEGGYVKIESAETGSIWLILSVGTIGAVNLIAAICWAAAVIRKKKAEAKIFEEHAKTLELKNESLKLIVDAQKQQLKNILDSEAKNVQDNNYSTSDPEVLGRLKLSISTVSDLIDRGTQILPSSDNKDVLKSFPDYSNLNLIESTLKKLKDEN